MIKNYTGRHVILADEDRTIAQFEMEGEAVLYRTFHYKPTVIDLEGELNMIRRITSTEVRGLPDPIPGVLFLVTPLVFAYVRDRDDVITLDDIFNEDRDESLVYSTLIRKDY